MKALNDYLAESESVFDNMFKGGISIIEGDDNNGREPRWDAVLVSPQEVRHEFHYAVNALLY